MQKPRASIFAVVAAPAVLAILVMLSVTTPALAQSPTSGSDRLFLSFAEDATVIDSQWWEGRLQFDSFDNIDRNLFVGLAAFQPWEGIEVGGTVGFGNTDSNTLPDGSGATDFDLWGKYHFGGNDNYEFAAGVLVTVPTGDDTAGLGTDAFAAGVFGSARYRLADAVLSGNIGARQNADATFSGLPEVDGEFSVFVGLGYLRPISDKWSFVGEARLETERFDGGDSDVRILAGVNVWVSNRGMLRGSIAGGLADGAPDTSVTAGYAHTF